MGGRGEGVRRWWRKGARTIVECVGAEAGLGRGGKAGYGQRGKEDMNGDRVPWPGAAALVEG